MQIETKLWRGVNILLDSYVEIHSDDRILLIYTVDSWEAVAWVSAALEMRNAAHNRLWMTPLVDPGFPARLEQALSGADKSPGRLVVLTFERDTMSHGPVLDEALARYDPKRVALFRTISAGSDLFESALQARPAELSARNTTVLEKCMNARRLRIRTKGGTDLDVSLDSQRHRWISNRGVSRPGSTTILPAGEVATYPSSVDGVHVADVAFNVNAIVARDARLERFPVTIWIEDGRVTRFRCESGETSRFLDDCFQEQCAVNIGELGFGTNFQIARPVAMNSHINERIPGVHLGLGQHNQEGSVVSYRCSIHLDLIGRGGMIWADDDPVPLDLERLEPSLNPHPTQARSEDVFSGDVSELGDGDCCGLLAKHQFEPSPFPVQ
ncbi:MAG TPA: aminopeptidase [Allosphingosinicella sp.]|jgi:hypothetical protein